jgi:hypothetical protein
MHTSNHHIQFPSLSPPIPPLFPYQVDVHLYATLTHITLFSVLTIKMNGMLIDGKHSTVPLGPRLSGYS